ncbi:MAG: protease HtpX [Bacteriovoracaceae bacterium]|jgi:heat shock protein HtpX|nr:protease HtpX [Bacteriovoracaceae bacterium]
MFKRVGLFLIMNITIMISVSLLMSIFNVQPYLSANGLNYQSLLLFCLIWGSVGSFISLQLSRWQAKKFMGVQLVQSDDPRFGSLVNTVYRLSKSAGLNTMPEVGIYNSPEVNAFATGPSKSRSLVAVSSGLLNSMNDDEVEGVLAHEVSHIANGDMVTMALIQGVVNAFVMFFARIAAFAIQNALRSNDEDNSSSVGGWSYYLTTMLFEVLFGFIGMFIIAFFSRYREYRADAGAAHISGSSKMIAALRRLQVQYEAGKFDKSTSKMNALKISSAGGLMSLLSTHPKLSDRISALERNR